MRGYKGQNIHKGTEYSFDFSCTNIQCIPPKYLQWEFVIIQTVGAACQLAGGLLIVYHLHLLEPRADYIKSAI